MEIPRAIAVFERYAGLGISIRKWASPARQYRTPGVSGALDQYSG
ncbi:hypothetical protein O5541_02665 [Escherichia coli]|nr:hypothetical protein [Escherichia coli]